jgi:hypothetical protein
LFHFKEKEKKSKEGKGIRKKGGEEEEGGGRKVRRGDTKYIKHTKHKTKHKTK